MALLVAQLATTLPLAGLIWTIQVVHYPLFARVGEAGFVRYHHEHSTLITWVVAAPMVVELLASLASLIAPAPFAPRWSVWLGAALVGLVWASTAWLQIPAHNGLAAGFSAPAHHTLVASNWVRTAAWTLRAVLVLVWTSRAMG